MINCVHFRMQWDERERLDPTDTMRMRRHLAACERCQAYDQQMRAERNAESLSASQANQ